MSITLLFLIPCFSALLYDASALVSDGLTLLSLWTHWTFVPPIINSTWNPSDSIPCSWVGVQCDHAHNVVSLNLTGHGIIGQLGPEIGQLYQLQTLVLLSNGFSGKVPSELSNCSLLEYLDLSDNSFSGQIPYSLKKLQNLQYMSLSSNLLSGEIPDSLFQIPHLEEVNLHKNLLSGPVPPNIGNLTDLSRLNLHCNRLSGTIPSSIGNCSKLEALFLNENRLNGELPLEIANLKHLKSISLFDNQFSGVIPQNLGINSSLVKLDFTNNKFTGNIPPNLCFGKQLRVLNMGSNQLQGSIASDVGRCATLIRLMLSENNLTGSLPDFESNLNLRYLHISKNNISGPIPTSLENCTNLAEINMSMNKFTGLIPSALGKLVNLVILDLAQNNLEGPLPPQLSNCTTMDHFDVGFNSLNGSFPSSLRSCTGITTLILKENRFTGGIPGFLSELNKLRELQLGGNLFGGQIPPSLGKLQNLFYGLNLSGNGLAGAIPLELGNLQELQSLDLSLNNLTGSIDVLDELLSLTEINISYNFLYGPVPKTLMKFLNSSPSSFLGNPHLCVSCSPSYGLNCSKTSYLMPCVYKSTDHKGIGKLVILMIELGSSIFVSAILVALLCMYLRRKSKQESNASDEQWSMSSVIKRGAGWIGFLYQEEIKMLAEKQSSSIHDLVMKATENLNDRYIIGQGAHGIVYKAQLGQLVFAVKKVAFGRNKKKRLSMICKEIQMLGKIKHRNLVTYADYWVGKDYGIVLYEYMQNGTLHDILHEENPLPYLSWNVRFKIAVGIAHGLKYLHYDCVPPILHRDIKPRNILLDVNMKPIIADFGTALWRNLAEHSDDYSQSRQKLSTYVVGTAGYIAPENAYAIVQSRKSDVYSYGVVLLELITRKKVVLEDGEQVTTLVSWARSMWVETAKVEKIVDSDLASAFPNSAAIAKQVTQVLLLALRCTDRDPRNRPTMRDVMGVYQQDIFKLSFDVAEVAGDIAPKRYNVPVVSYNPNFATLRGRVRKSRKEPFWSSWINLIKSMPAALVRMYVRRKSKREFNASCEKQSAIEEEARETDVLYGEEMECFAEMQSPSIHDIVMEATENLNDRHIIGKGADGVVYKIQHPHLTCAAKKIVLGEHKKKRFGSMREEYQAFLMIRHRNLVAYKACLFGEDYGLFLCDYMKNGSLHDILHEKNPPSPLAWNVRFKIADGIAQGLQHMHHDRYPPIVHGDIKAKNILLDADMEPHISDFWTALIRKRVYLGDTVSYTAAGTAGYIAPEYAYEIVSSNKFEFDVYSYGVVLLELITRKKAVLEDEEQVTTLVSWARSMWVETREIEKIIDPDLASAFPNSEVLANQVTEVLLLALRCTERMPHMRPTMTDVMRFYRKGKFNLSCDDVVDDSAEVAIDVAPQPYNVPVVSTDPYVAR